MRALLLLSLAALVCLPLASAVGPVPTISVSLDPPSLSLNASRSDQIATFTGSVSVNKSALLSATVTLAAEVSSGWKATLTPAAMTFTTTNPQSFSCTVVVPAGTPGGNESMLTVTGTVVSGILQNTARATAAILVVGTLPNGTNQTGNNTNGTKPPDPGNQTIPIGIGHTEGTPGILGYSYEQWGLIGAVTLAVAVAAVVLVRARRKRKAALDVESVEEG